MKVQSILAEVMVNDREIFRGARQASLNELDQRTNKIVEGHDPDQVRIEDAVTIREGDGAAIWAIVLRKVIIK